MVLKFYFGLTRTGRMVTCGEFCPAEKAIPFLADQVSSFSLPARCSAAYHVLSTTDHTDSRKDYIHAANKQEHDLTFHLQV
jgi:hypothetical protein